MNRHPAYSTYFYAIVVLGVASVGLSAYDLIRHPVSSQWLILAALTAVAGSFAVKIPLVNSKISIADTFVFTNLILFGPAAGSLTAGLDGLLGSMRSSSSSRRVHYSLFNSSAMAFSAYLSGAVFLLVSGQPPLSAGSHISLREIVWPMGAMALAYYVLNSSSVAVIIALDLRQNVYHVWKKNFLWTSVTYFTGASVAALLALNVTSITPAVLGVIVPVMLVSYYTYKTHLDRVEENLHRQELHTLYLNTVEALALAIDAKDHATYGHARRVQVLTRGLARAMGIVNESDLMGIETAALLHDIGNLAVPEYILNKPGKLTPGEAEKMMVHPIIGAEILGTINFPYPVAKFVRHHHENWDGSGYPDKLKGEEIPLGARILSVADTFEALTGDRPYQGRHSKEDAIGRIRNLAGTRFDPTIVEKFEEMLDVLLRELDEITGIQVNLKVLAAEESIASDTKTKLSGNIKKSLVFQDISSAHKEVFALYEFAQTLGSSLDLHETSIIIASKIKKLIPFSTCVIYLYSPSGDSLSANHATGAEADAFEKHSLDMESSISGWVASNRKPAVNVDPAPDLKLLNADLGSKLRNSLIFPLEYNGDPLGTISLYNTDLRPYGDDHVRIMGVISMQASTAIRNALKFEESREDACTDPLTGLPNARYLHLHFEQEREKAMRNESSLAVMVMDLDGFKAVNDTFGHPAGDRFLVEIAKIIRANLRGADVAVRYAGDEFVAVLPQTRLADAWVLAQRVQSAVDSYCMEVHAGKFARAGISIGLSVFPEQGETLDILLQEADTDMYRDKAQRAGSRRELLDPSNPHVSVRSSVC